MADRNIKVDNNILAVEVQLAASARALGLDTSRLEEELVSRGVRLYSLYGASRTLSPEEARDRIAVVMNFVDRQNLQINPEYKKVLKEKTKGGE